MNNKKIKSSTTGSTGESTGEPALGSGPAHATAGISDTWGPLGYGKWGDRGIGPAEGENAASGTPVAKTAPEAASGPTPSQRPKKVTSRIPVQ